MSEHKQGDELLTEFREEAMDLLQDLPEALTQYQRDTSDAEGINRIFRSVHTIKGNAGFFGLVAVKSFAHLLEDAFDDIRQGNVALSEDLCRLLVAGLDALEEMVVQVGNGDVPSALNEQQSQLLAQIESLCEQSKNDSPEAHLLREINKLADELAASEFPQREVWTERLRSLTSSSSGSAESKEQNSSEEQASSEPLDHAALVKQHFELAGQDVTSHVVPTLEIFAAVEGGTYQDTHGRAFLEAMEVLIVKVEEHKQPEIAQSLKTARTDFETIFNSPLDVDAILLSVIWERLGPELVKLQKRAAAPPPAKKPETSEPPKAAAASAEKSSNESKSRFLRVKEERVDEFLDDVSSLFITCERLKDLHSRMSREMQTNELLEELRQINATLSGQSTSLQRSVVELRKVPVRGLFSKFPRVARSLASKLGKQLDVHLDGEEIEIDKSLVEDLDGPLMHMVRNVCDHGIETPDDRQARGASPTGNMWIKCELTKSHVVITVRDDGRGIDPARLRRKAVEKGIYSQQEADLISNQTAIELIFHPGLSTAEQISEISGRGVGLDVVRTRLREHNGDVKVSSVVGKGTTFHLEIPIRRAVVVVDGLLVQQDGTTYVLPFENIREIVCLDRQNMSRVQGEYVAKVRGEPYGAIRLGRLLGSSRREAEDEQIYGVLIKDKTGLLCLLVDSIVGQRKVVVSDLSESLPGCERISGVAQLGGGKLALVLNAADLILAAGRLGRPTPGRSNSGQAADRRPAKLATADA